MLSGALKADNYKIIKVNVPNNLLEIVTKKIPALKSLTINSLANGNNAIESVVEQSQLANIKLELTKMGIFEPIIVSSFEAAL